MSLIKLIAFDLDGTVLPMMGTQPSADFCIAVEEAAEAGAVPAVFTGRSLTTIPQNFYDMDCIKFFCYANGAGIIERKTQKLIYKSNMPKQLCLDILNILASYDLLIQVFSMGSIIYPKSVMENLGNNHLPPHHLLAVQSGNASVVDSLYSHVRDNSPPIDKINITRIDDETRCRLIPELKKLPELDIVSSGGINLELCYSKSNKGFALQFLADYLGLDMSEVMAIGDQTNDNLMIDYAGIGVAMGDGAPETRAMADFVTAGLNDEGASLAIRKFVL